MKYQPQNDVLDPDFPMPDETVEVDEAKHADAPDDAYVIGEHGNTVQTPPEVNTKRRKRRGQRQWVMPTAFVLSLAFVGLTVWNVSHVLSGPPRPKPTPFQVKQTLYLGVMRIEAYKRVHGVTPETLSDAGLPDGAGYTYTRVDPTRYVLSFSANGPNLEYTSSDPKESFFGTPKDMLSMGGPK